MALGLCRIPKAIRRKNRDGIQSVKGLFAARRDGRRLAGAWGSACSFDSSLLAPIRGAAYKGNSPCTSRTLFWVVS